MTIVGMKERTEPTPPKAPSQTKETTVGFIALEVKKFLTISIKASMPNSKRFDK